ncbi:hypothetical protein QJS04_geneDACA019111 [Acorus gramineus]|uniref:Uncharacterized protein n=1 Tax=Acorus gramineus TaxID=55184 RepID=A0AAV9A9G0_ACOGR|nr:hypothetical protein QJS04_geneDACA019111 [Acorus gramineus]
MVMLLRDGGGGPAIGGGKNREEPGSSRHSGERGVKDDLHRSRWGCLAMRDGRLHLFRRLGFAPLDPLYFVL